MSSGPKTPPPPERVDPGADTMSYLFGSGSEYEGMGVASPEVQQAILEAERLYGPEYILNELRRAEVGLFGDDNQAGLLDQARRGATITEGMRADVASLQRTSDIADVERLGGRATEAVRASDPDRQRLMVQERSMVDDLFARAQGVTPQQSRLAQQGSREAFGDRGRTMGNASIFGEALGREEYMRQNRQEALQAAGGMFGQYMATGADPFQSVLGRPSNALAYNQASGQQALGLNAGPGVFNPDTGINIAMQENANLADYNANVYGAAADRSGAVMGGLLGAAGTIFGGPIGGAIGKGIGGMFG